MKREANRSLMEDFDFQFDDWELSEVYKNFKFNSNIKIFEISNGDPSVIFALSLILKKYIKGVLSIDPVSNTEIGSELFKRKKIAFSTIYAEGCLKTESIETESLGLNIIDSKIFNKVTKYFDDCEKPSITILNFCKNKFYTMQILKKYEPFIENGYIIFNNLYENKDWEDIFLRYAKDKKFVILKKDKGLGLIMAE
jgi:hypothetical protein